MCYYLNAQFQGQRVKKKGVELSGLQAVRVSYLAVRYFDRNLTVAVNI